MRTLTVFVACALLFVSCAGGEGADPTPGVDTVEPQDAAQDVGLDIARDPPDEVATDTTPDAAADAAPDAAPDVPTLPPIEPAACGQAPFEWLGPDAVGDVILWEESAMTNVSVQFLIETIEAMGYSKSLEGIEHSVRNFRMRYTTQDKGASIEATSMVGIPSDVPPDSTLPVLLWLHPTTGFNDNCAPSRDPLAGPGQTSIMSSLGYISVAPDFIGQIGFGEGSPAGTIHPYLVGQPTAVASLDALRAALRHLAEDPDLPDGDPTRIILWGGSQGGHGCFITERMQPYYAPEFDIIAVAAAIPGTDLLKLAEYGAQHWSDTSIGLAGVLIAMQAWYGFGDLSTVLTDDPPNHIASTAGAVMAEECGGGGVFSGLDGVEQVYTEGFRAAAAGGTLAEFPDFGCFLRESSVDRMALERVPSDTPFLATFGELDDLVQTPVELEAMARYCAQGYRIEYVSCAGLGHVETAGELLPYMARWTKDRLDGVEWPATAICESTEPVDCSAL
jgi:hypothetical protein